MSGARLPDQVRDWWNARPVREQRLLGAGGIALALILAWLLVWEPLAGLSQRRAADLAAARALATQLETLAAAAQAAGPAARPDARRGASLLSVIDQSVKVSGIGKAPARLQPDGEALVRIWFEDVPFDSLLRWQADLRNRHGISVTEAEIERESGSGLVNARLTLERPA